MRWVMALCLVVGCSNITSMPGGDSQSLPKIAITVDRRPAAHSLANLVLVRRADGVDRVNIFAVTDADFPITFEVDSPSDSAPVAIQVQGFDDYNVLVGLGDTTAPAGATTATVWMQGSDFVVNGQYAGNQFLTNDFETVGLQLAATPGFDTWMLGFRDECVSCNIYGRRFDSRGFPLYTSLASSGGQFQLNTTAMTSAAIPALAGTSDRIVTLWDFTDTTGSGHGIGCRSIDIGGFGNPPATITTDAADVVTASWVSVNDHVVVTWQTFTTTQVVRTMTVSHDCSAVSAPVTVSTATGTTGARRSHVAAVGVNLLYAWIVDGDVHVRTGYDDGTFTSIDQVLLAQTTQQTVDYVRVAPWGTDFAVAVRWAATSGAGPGKIEVYRVSITGQILSPAYLITDTSGSDFASNKAFGLASRVGQTLFVTWHACPTGPGSCDVYGRSLTALGSQQPAFVIPTTSDGDQTNPSVVAIGDDFVVAWTDASGFDPDSSGSSVRARIIRPD